MRKSNAKRVIATALTMCMAFGASACGKSGAQVGGGEFQQVDASELTFPLAEKTTLTGTISYPANTESDPNNRTIFKRLQEQTNVEIQWTAIQSDQWGDKITLEMSNVNTLTDFVFSAGFSDSDLLKYAKQGAIISLEDYIDAYMPNLKAVFDKYP
ncbi:MAG: extracellular solute-binding protein, partial [Butyrivibrio sp.]|nr:extracellular solute-binding protein [Butyrivibrio sp.]